jgi:two-component system OmpR family sensor kinase
VTATVRPRATWTLRRRVVVTVLALLLGTAAMLAVTSSFALRRALVHQLDEQLLAASARSERHGREDHEPPDPPGEAEPPPLLSRPGQRTGTVAMTLDADGSLEQAGFLDDAAEPRPLDGEQVAVLRAVPADGRARTVAVPGLGDVRVVAHEIGGGEVLLTGLPLADVEATQAGFLAIEVVVVGVALVAAGLVAAVVVRRSLRPLDRMAATATRVAELPLHRGEVSIRERLSGPDADPRTEVGQVGAALNRMLGHVEAALAARHASETQVRQFVADASHELRTPLASIRGYAELVRRSPEGTPDATLRAVARVESEALRMSTLVDDLLLLARLDAGRPLAREEVDVAALAVDALADAHAAGPDHRWRLDVPEEGAVVVGDGPRLHQVLANLLSNARTHTPAGTTVQVLGRPEPAWRDLPGTPAQTPVPGVLLEVHDDGPGVPAELVPVLFRRFTRGDAARSRSAGSTGLGLAIADAIVAAHHGTLTVRSEAGSTTFAVWLPAVPPPPHAGAHAAAPGAEGAPVREEEAAALDGALP